VSLTLSKTTALVVYGDQQNDIERAGLILAAHGGHAMRHPGPLLIADVQPPSVEATLTRLVFPRRRAYAAPIGTPSA
jgi:hypothetical protein